MAESTAAQIRILVVDDSAFMRKALTMMLESDPMIKVIATARDGAEGVEKVKRLKPDLVTMDIEMPRMDGLTALREIMLSMPTPVMMISSLTTDGANATLDALELGAVDFIPKQLSYVSLDIVKIKDELLAKIKDIVRRKTVLMKRLQSRSAFRKTSGTQRTSIGRDGRSAAAVAPPPPRQRVIGKRSHPVSIVIVGSSTGGPPALQTVIPRLPRNFPVGIVVAQHMPPTFTKSLAERLNQLSQVQVKEAAHGDPIEPGTVLIAPGGQHLTVKRAGARAHAVVSSQPETTLYKPCVDVTSTSVAEAYGRATLGVMLTGMGNNGVIGFERIKSKGGVVVAQSEATCVVYGMPRAVIEAKLADYVSSVEDIAAEIVSFF
jgi:two-component system chemotaxis response regulator CheB